MGFESAGCPFFGSSSISGEGTDFDQTSQCLLDAIQRAQISLSRIGEVISITEHQATQIETAA